MLVMPKDGDCAASVGDAAMAIKAKPSAALLLDKVLGAIPFALCWILYSYRTKLILYSKEEIARGEVVASKWQPTALCRIVVWLDGIVSCANYRRVF